MQTIPNRSLIRRAVAGDKNDLKKLKLFQDAVNGVPPAGAHLHSSTSQLNRSRLLSLMPKLPFTCQLSRTFFLSSKLRKSPNCPHKVLTSSRKVGACSTWKVLTLSWRADECKPLAGGQRGRRAAAGEGADGAERAARRQGGGGAVLGRGLHSFTSKPNFRTFGTHRSR